MVGSRAGAEPSPALWATGVGSPPRIDGHLDEVDWRRARPLRDLRQRRPSSGGTPWQQTEVRVLFDEGALYLGVRLYDREPGRVRRSLGPRDAAPDSDNVTVFLDPLHTRERAYYFQLSAAGVQSDGLVYDQLSLDGSWDATWTGAVQLFEGGWTAELRIPLSGLAFQADDEQRWGFYIERYVQRTKEVSGWPAIPKDSNLFVARFGELRGLKHLRRALALRLQPYAALELQLARRAGSLYDRTARPNAGLDLRWGVAADLMLSATLNPDFGQVEQDPAVVNLSPTEVWFGERRPFFVADADVFRTPIELLHSRRIGASPSAPAPSPGAHLVSLDRTARILGAAKLVGHAGPLLLGGLTTLVLPSHAVEEGPRGQLELEASPLSHYGVARMRAQLARSAAVGLLVTTLNRAGPDATAGGLDWDLRAGSGWQTVGQLTGSSTGEGAGYGLYVQAGQLGAPVWRGWLELESFSPDYQINDVGYQWRDDMVTVRGYLQRRLQVPWRALREGNATLYAAYGFNHTDPRLGFERRVEAWAWGMLRSLWELWGGAGYRFFALDDRETRGGPAYPRPGDGYAWLGARSDSSRRVFADASISFDVEGSSPGVSASGSLNVSPWDPLTVRVTAAGLWYDGRRRWVATQRERGRPPRYLFARADRAELDLRFATSLTLLPRLTVSATGQLLHSVARHRDAEELFVLADGATTLGPTGDGLDADFSRTSLLLGAQARWDFGGGAAAYLVYRLDGLAHDAEPGGFDLGGGLGDLLGRRQEHLLVVKISYGWEL